MHFVRLVRFSGLLLLITAVTACGPSATPGAIDASGEPPPADAHTIHLDAPPIDAPTTPSIDASHAPDASIDAGCIPNPDSMGAELCNGVDDNCNGQIDEGFPGVGNACNVGVGACARTGTTICRTDGSGTTCSAMPGAPGVEQCGNGIDDNCNGLVDEGFPMLGMACSAGVGACAASGTYVCSADHLSATCNATPGTPGPIDLCGNGIDDNCNGLVDEGYPTLGTACTVGVGACLRTGTVVCAPGGMTTQCSAVAGMMTAELCNGIDDDCDGTTDEGFMLGAPCDGPDTDLCQEGTIVCNGSGGASCNDTTGNNVEVCNGIDDDCNPATPDGASDPAVGLGCDGPDTDLCNEGTTYCGPGGVLGCTDTTGNNVELCNGLDDDCNPATPDGSGDPSLGVPCDGPDADLCNEGVTYCGAAGFAACSDTTGDSPEICGNGIDDNCNGQIDEGCAPTCAHGNCVAGAALNASACGACASNVCIADAFCCTTSWDSICVNEAATMCGTCASGTCGHAECSTGSALVSGCDTAGCTAAVCAGDPYCCDTTVGAWDSICMGEAETTCGLTCAP
jgi:hypothetical protein